jgi:hypothetical protein
MMDRELQMTLTFWMAADASLALASDVVPKCEVDAA